MVAVKLLHIGGVLGLLHGWVCVDLVVEGRVGLGWFVQSCRYTEKWCSKRMTRLGEKN